MTGFEYESGHREQLLPFVGAAVIDAYHQDVLAMAMNDDLEGFLHDNVAILRGDPDNPRSDPENPGVAMVLFKLIENIAGDEDLNTETKMLLAGVVVYRLLRNQAEAERMDALPVQEETETRASLPASQEEAEVAKEAAALARSLTVDLLAEEGMAIPNGVDEVTVNLVRRIHDPTSIYSTSTFPDSHKAVIKVSGVDPVRADEQRPLEFEVVKVSGPKGKVDGRILEDGTSEFKSWRGIQNTVHELRDALREFSDLPGQFSVDVSMQLQLAENVTDSRITRPIFPDR